MKIFRNRTVIGVLCILLALIICFGVTPLFSRSASEKTEIVRVTKDIKEGDEITAEMVQTVEVGAYNLPQNLMTDKKEVVGKYATADLAAGDYILSSGGLSGQGRNSHSSGAAVCGGHLGNRLLRIRCQHR